jgi:hypothetical protein
MFSPVVSTTTKTPAGLTLTNNVTRSVTESASGSLATFTETSSLNGAAWTSVFDAKHHDLDHDQSRGTADAGDRRQRRTAGAARRAGSRPERARANTDRSRHGWREEARLESSAKMMG